MKKLLSLLLGIIIVISSLKAQDQPKYELGFQGGWVIGTADGSAIDKDRKDALSGVGFGLNIKRNLHKGFALKLGLNYEQLGWAYRDLAFEPSTVLPGSFFVLADVLQRKTYLNIPILAEYSFGKKVLVHLNAGPFVGFLLKSSTTLDYKDDEYNDKKSTTNNIKPLNAGVATGFGLSYPLTSTIKINLQGSQQFGLLNVGKNASSNTTKLNAFSLTTGLSFSL